MSCWSITNSTSTAGMSPSTLTPFTRTCRLCVALAHKPSRRSVCSSKLHPDTKTNYITQASWFEMHDRNQPWEEVTACYLGNLMSCTERSSKLTLAVAAVRREVRTVTSAGTDDSHSVLLHYTGSLPLPPLLLFLSYILSLFFSMFFSFSGFSELACCFPLAVHLLASL